MNKKLSPVQAIIFAVLILAIFIGVIMFAVNKGGQGKQTSPITMWGTFPQEDIRVIQKLINDEAGQEVVNIIYTEIEEAEFEDTLIEALASGKGPDTVIMREDLLVKHENKLFKLEYDFYPQKNYKDTFVEESEMLLRNDGILGFPIAIDPLVMYWNRSILNSAGVSQPPTLWSEFVPLIPRIVKSDSQSNITMAGISLGEFSNINNSEEILVSLIQQAGNPIISLNSEDEYESVIDQRMGYKVRPAEAALTFFTQFSNPSKTSYSWNRSLPTSQEMFTSGDLAFYLGFASEREEIILKNPNLNFDITMLPQSSSSNTKSTYGKMYYVSILNQSQNIGDAFSVAVKLSEASSIEKIADVLNLSPVRRDLLVDEPALSYLQVFNKSALISRGVFNVDPETTTQIYSNMISNVTSGRTGVTDAVNRASAEFREIYKK